jgi:UDP-4-amino-4,6-dideoxy-N-acetyl-beta-L-altrosamine transaminase
MIPYGRQTIEDDDVASVASALRGDWLTQGPTVAEFEKALADYCGVKHAVVVANGTAALQAAYFAAGLKTGDEIVTTTLTFAATASAAVWMGAKPVFADIDDATGNLDPRAAEAAITAKTRALVPMDFSGRPADMDAFRVLAKKKGLLLISDACHSLGASLGGRKAGALADLSCFSFHPVKSITTGEGGAVLTDDDKLAKRLIQFRQHGVTKRYPDWRYEIGELAQNFRLTDFQCALGLSQLRKLDRFVARRAEIAAAYQKDLAGVDGLRLPPPAAPGACAWHLFPVRVPAAARTAVFADLRAAGIGVQVHYVPVHRHPLYERLGYPRALCPKAERFSDEEISLPIFPTLSEAERAAVVAALKRSVAAHVPSAARS